MVQILENYPLSQLTTLQIGGPAKYFTQAKTEEELKEALEYATKKQLPFLVVGGGSNLLVSDQGVDKLIVKNEISSIRQEGQNLVVKSGTNLQELVDYSINHNLAGLERLTGIPGTVGGAIYGNAGAYGQTISDHLVEVVCLDPNFQECQTVTLGKEDCQFSYRDSAFKSNGLVILEIEFKLSTRSSNELEKEAEEILAKRVIRYPPGIRCPGSFFKNIVAETLSQEILAKIPAEKIVFGKVPAGALLEMVGAKGDKLDGIYIAPYHANLFVNSGGGTADDFYQLANKYWIKVKERFSVTLEPEVQLINLPKFNL